VSKCICLTIKTGSQTKDVCLQNKAAAEQYLHAHAVKNWKKEMGDTALPDTAKKTIAAFFATDSGRAYAIGDSCEVVGEQDLAKLAEARKKTEEQLRKPAPAKKAKTAAV
jgi:type IV secretory pathway VirD2 relaxase